MNEEEGVPAGGTEPTVGGANGAYAMGVSEAEAERLTRQSGFYALFTRRMFQEAGIEVGEVIEAGGHQQAALALYNGEVDFATTYFSPPLTDPKWQIGDSPEPYDPAEVALNEKGRVYAGDVRVLDARATQGVMETAPDMFVETRIMRSLGPNGCDEAAAEAVRGVKWNPAYQRDRAVKVWVTIPVEFKLIRR